MLPVENAFSNISAVNRQQAHKESGDTVADGPVKPHAPSADQVCDYVADTGSDQSGKRTEECANDNRNDHCGRQVSVGGDGDSAITHKHAEQSGANGHGYDCLGVPYTKQFLAQAFFCHCISS